MSMGGGEPDRVQSTVHNLGSSFVEEDSTPLYNQMILPVSSQPNSYQLSAGYGGEEAPPTASAQPSLNPSVTETVKKKRGRPRKYAPDGSRNPWMMSPVRSLSPAGTRAAETETSPKKRGRPSGRGRKRKMDEISASAAVPVGSPGAGYGFKPHVITINAGEDVQAKLMSFSQSTSQAICIMSANGAISNVSLRQPAISGGSVTYEGRFEILSLSGSFIFSEVGGQRSRTGGLSVSLAGPDGSVLGGSVAGLLIAAAPVQVIVGSFRVDVEKLQKPGRSERLSASPPPPPPLGRPPAEGPRSPPSFGSLSESSGPPSPPAPTGHNQHLLETSTNPPAPTGHNQHLLETSTRSPPGVSSFPWR
ncbi:unnamed protein product [Cuscuta europaea]|uniref:AT-hook motif nuclear-localized protein n=1 Tax=Cuscuta europaea TaxID=41803 RepID=A0A9P0ZPB9_CUSEU|nr:unnamed protein product [Cuscuta europaea]